LLIFVAALAVAACGRQVTPNPTSGGGSNGSGLNPGFMQLKFTIAAPFNFQAVRYVIVFNTSGAGTTPYANGNQTNYQNYSFAFIVGGSGATVAQPILVQYLRQSSGSLVQPVQLPYAPQQVIFSPNSNGLGTQFSIIFDRTLLYGIATPAPSPTSSATPSSSPSPSPSPTPSATPSTGPTPTPTPSSGPTPAPQPTTQSQTVWFVNFFTTDPNGNPYDALGTQGAMDQSFNFNPPIDTTQIFDETYYVPAGAIQAPQPYEEITTAEIANNP
ncbi:MAG: hypothetical protein ACYDG3_11730, partial [Bacillati bacterium]